MSIMTIGHAATSTHRPTLSGLLSRARREIGLWHARRAMAGLDDHMLHDIGVDRGEVEIAVRSGRAGLRR